MAVLRPVGRIEKNQTVLIHAAAGATGQAAVKIAKHYGATVIPTASPEKHAIVQSLGADHIALCGEFGAIQAPTLDGHAVLFRVAAFRG
ncbi:hypothetical protein [Rhizobium leguminosarum]